MNMSTLAFIAPLLLSLKMAVVACGTQEAANDAKEKAEKEAKEEEETSSSKEPEATARINSESSLDEDTPKEPSLEAPKGPKELTKEQSVRLMTRLSFDRLLAQDQVFKAESFQAYYIKGDEGTMSYPDTQYVPAGSKTITTLSCPLGFKQVGQIELSIGVSEGLFDKLSPDSQWVWTNWDAGTSQKYALVTSDFTDQWGYSFMSQMFYPKHKSRILGRLYCIMKVSDLPNIDDIPEGYKTLYSGS